MGGGDLAQTLSACALLENSDPVDIERAPADVPPLQPGATHSCPHPFDDEIAFELSDGADDDDDGPPERASGIKVLAEADELDVEMVELIQHFEEVADGPGDPVRGPDQEYLEAAAACIPKQIIEARPASLRPRDPVSVLGNDLKTPLLSHRAEIVELSLRVLVDTGYAQVKGNSFHICSLIEATTSCKKLDSRSSCSR
jgi:hypothetical protein